MPSLLHTTLKQKWGGGVCLNIHFVSCIRPSCCSSHTCSAIVTITTAFWKNVSFDERVLQEISCACVDTKPRGIEATCIVSCDRGRPRVSLHFQCEQQKPLRWPANKAIVLNFWVYVFTNTIDDGAKPEAH